MNTQPVIGISGCLTGSVVRSDDGRKRTGSVTDEFAQRVVFKPVCPEMMAGLSIPHLTLRLVQTPVGEIRIRFSHAPYEDVMEEMADFASAHLTTLDELSGFIVYAKSPSCGMGHVRLCDEKGNRGRKEGMELLTGALIACYPRLPTEEGGRLYDPLLQKNFVEHAFVPHGLNTLRARGLTRHGLLAFHSHYKLQLLAHYQAGYWGIGLFVASLHEWEDLEVFPEVYREKSIAILRWPASWKNHTDVLMYTQGYLHDQFNSHQRGELREVIFNYRIGLLPILALLALLKHYLAGYPDRYLQAQNYSDPYSQDLALRLAVNQRGLGPAVRQHYVCVGLRYTSLWE